jgi:hypothetical protein
VTDVDTVILTVTASPLPAAPHLIVYRTADGAAHRVEGNLLEGIAIPAGTHIEHIAFATAPTSTFTLLLDGVELPAVE